jgi:hypothetical protein
MFKDPFIEELHKIREAYARRFGFDLDAMVKDLKKKEQHHKDRLAPAGKRRVKKVA